MKGYSAELSVQRRISFLTHRLLLLSIAPELGSRSKKLPIPRMISESLPVYNRIYISNTVLLSILKI